MSKILLIYASRYGSAKQIAGIIAGCLRAKGLDTVIADVNSRPDVKGYDMVLLGSGIYSHKFLPEMERFIEENRCGLLSAAVGMFGVAMRTEVIHKNGRSFGGELILDRYRLDPAVKGMLHGRMDFNSLTARDREGLERFYDSIGLSEGEKSERRKLRDEVSAEECAAFADAVYDHLSVT